MGKRTHTEAIRAVKLPVDTVEGDWKETTQRWHELQSKVTQMSNMIWREWEIWHVQHDTISVWKEWYERWKEIGKEAGHPPVEAVPNELSKLIYRKLRDEFPDVHSRVVDLVKNPTLKRISSQSAAKGSIKSWLAILLCNEGRPSFTKPLPIPFDKKNTKLEMTDDRHPTVTLRMEKPEGSTKYTSDVIRLLYRGKSLRSRYEAFKKILAGEWEFKGSSLSYEKSEKKWYVNLMYSRPVQVVPNLDHSKRAFVLPFKDLPFVFHDQSAKGHRQRWTWLQGRGYHIGAVRHRAFTERISRNENYSRATRRKGHGHSGRKEAKRTWYHFVRSVNDKVSRSAVDECVRRGIGQLVFVQPKDAVAQNRFVSTAGRTDKRDHSSWEFFTLKTAIKNKCHAVGIEPFEVDENGKIVPMK